ncbi:hypothetical protein STENM327S_08304 [Streptomyces tendae]
MKETSRPLRSSWSSAIASERSVHGVGVGQPGALDVEVRLCGPGGVQGRAVYAAASAEALSQAAASSVPDAPPKETRTLADFFSFSTREATEASSMSCTPFQRGTQSSPDAMTNARLYAVGEPAVSVAEAVVALT